MHLLPCPACDSPIRVSRSQAGGETTCPGCGTAVPIPTLGQLRRLPPAEMPELDPRAATHSAPSAVRSIGFGLFAFAAVGCLIVAVFCGIRWYFTEVSMTTDQHVAELRQAYKTLEPARLIREYEEMEQYGLDLPSPYAYTAAVKAKRAWGRNALIAAALGTVTLLIALIMSAAGRRKSPA